VLELVNSFHGKSTVFQKTGGVHSAALCDEHRIIVFAEDIGRYNAIDRVIGKCYLDNIPAGGGIIITSGRVSAETVRKVARAAVPVIVSRSAPTSLGVSLAASLGITLIGFARGDRMNVYTGTSRITR